MGFRQWESVNRHVRKGEKAVYILAPCLVKSGDAKANDDGDGEAAEASAMRLVGFRGIPVFGLEQTSGAPIEGREEEEAFIDALPLVEVARAWGVTVTVYNGRETKPLGRYSPYSNTIALGEGSKTTWLHELAHAADHRLGETDASRANREIVAELSAAVLATLIGLPEDERNIGYALAYIRHFAGNKASKALQLIDRACKVVDAILCARDAVTPAAALAVDAAEVCGPAAVLAESLTEAAPAAPRPVAAPAVDVTVGPDEAAAPVAPTRAEAVNAAGALAQSLTEAAAEIAA